MYFDTSLIAKFYLNEPESSRVRALVRNADVIYTSVWAFAELHAVLHRRLREHSSSAADIRKIALTFNQHIEKGLWELIPVTEALLRRTAALIIAAPRNVFIRAADAVHLVTARDAGQREIWTNDRHMLAAAEYFGVSGRAV